MVESKLELTKWSKLLRVSESEDKIRNVKFMTENKESVRSRDPFRK